MGRLLKGKGHVVPRLVMSAREQAQQVLEAARAAGEVERRRGYEVGLAEGREAAAAELTETLVRARSEAEEMREASREAAIPLARRMAERIVGRALELHPSLIGDIAAQALAASRARTGAVTLRVHPLDLFALEQQKPRLLARLPSVDLTLVVRRDGRPGWLRGRDRLRPPRRPARAAARRPRKGARRTDCRAAFVRG